MRALVVDDSTSSRAAITGALGRAGFQVLESGDSLEALDLLKARGGVDLALVDWDLPEADGLRFVLGLRSACGFEGTRLIMLTRQPSTAEILDAIRVGVDDCIIKPFTRAKLREKLVQLRLRKD